MNEQVFEGHRFLQRIFSATANRLTRSHRVAGRINPHVANQLLLGKVVMGVREYGRVPFEGNTDAVSGSIVDLGTSGWRMNAFADTDCNRRADNAVMIADSW
jgi:hypothetical protein